MSDEITYEQHIQQNNQRLISIRNNLADPSGYSRSCQELTGWCSDSRAFHAAFEENLIATLEAIVVQSSHTGYDRDLAKQLIAACFAHRKLLSKANTTKVTRWHDQLRKPKRGGTSSKRKSSATKSQATTAAAISTAPSASTTVVATPVADADPTQNVSLNLDVNYAVSDQYLSPDSFVDGSCPVFVDSHSAMWAQQGNAAMYGDQSVMFGGGDQQAAALQAQQQAMSFASPNHPYPSGGHPMMAGPNMTPQIEGGVPPQYPIDPSGARPMRTALDEQQRQMLIRQQQQFMRMRNPQVSPYMPGQGPPPPQQVNPQCAMPPGVPQGMQPMNGGYPNIPPCGSASMIRAGPPMLYSQMQQQGQQKVTAFPNPHALHADSPAVAMQSQPAVVLRELILGPFALQGPQSSITFTLNENTFNALQYADVELQLKPFLRDDQRQSCNWPMLPPETQDLSIPVRIAINGVEQQIKSRTDPLYIKQFCQLGANSIQIFSNHAGNHLFTLQHINRPSLSALLTNIIGNWRNAQSDLEKCRERAFKLIQSSMGASDGIKVPLFCPLTKRRLCYPARSAKCMHMACFELEPFLAANREETHYGCPICRVVFTIHELKLDGYVTLLLQNTVQMPESREVTISANGSWRVVDPEQPQPVPQQPMQAGNSLKRHMSEQMGAGNMKRYRPDQNGVKVENGIAHPHSVPSMAVHNGGALLSPYTTAPTGSPTVSGAATIGGPKNSGGSATFTEMPITPASSLTSSSPNGTASTTGLRASAQPEPGQQTSGSAPYTPASVGSVNSGVNSTTSNGLQNSTFNDLPSLVGDSDVCDLFSDFVHNISLSNADLQRYLFDDPPVATYSSCQANIDLNNSDEWRDLMQIVGQDR